jgi:hypothetical protein
MAFVLIRRLADSGCRHSGRCCVTQRATALLKSVSFKFDVSREELKKAVEQAGPMVKEVRAGLRGRQENGDAIAVSWAIKGRRPVIPLDDHNFTLRPNTSAQHGTPYIDSEMLHVPGEHLASGGLREQSAAIAFPALLDRVTSRRRGCSGAQRLAPDGKLFAA